MIKMPIATSIIGMDQYSSSDELWTYSGPISAGKAVYISGANQVSVADAFEYFGPAIGFVSKVVNDTFCHIRSTGLLITNSAEAGVIYYLGANGGLQSGEVAEGSKIIQPLARGKNATTLKVMIGQAIHVKI